MTTAMPREKVLTVCFNHETNTFSVSPTTMADFSFRGLLMGAEVEQKHAGSSTEHVGFIAAGERLGLELVHAVFARAQPAGRVADEDTEEVVVIHADHHIEERYLATYEMTVTSADARAHAHAHARDHHHTSLLIDAPNQLCRPLPLPHPLLRQAKYCMRKSKKSRKIRKIKSRINERR